MANISMQELSELSNDELMDIQRFIEAEMKVRSDRETIGKVRKLAYIIQEIIDLGYTLREYGNGVSDCVQYVLEDNEKGIGLYRINPDYTKHDEEDMVNYGYTLKKWDGKKKAWEDITNA